MKPIQILLFTFMIPLLGCSQASLQTEVGDQNLWDRAHSHCDTDDQAYKEEIAKALDEKADQINHYHGSGSGVPQFRRYPLGPLTLLEKIPMIGPKKETDEYKADSWKKLHERYLALKNKPVNDEWYDLDYDVRYMLFDDRWRRLSPEASVFTTEKKAILEETYTHLATCTEQPECSMVHLSGASLQFLNDYEPYQALWKKSAFATLENLIKEDYQTYYGFHLNSTVKRVSADELLVSLDPGPFECCTWFLGQVIEKAWSSPKLHVKIQWEHGSLFKDVFRLTLDPHLNGRQHVSWRDRIVVLHPIEQETTLAHEIGHVIGFPDHYYTNFNEATCSYTVSFNLTDLMSVGELPTADEFKELDHYYPWKP